MLSVIMRKAGCIPAAAYTPRALVPLRSTALVVGSYNVSAVCFALGCVGAGIYPARRLSMVFPYIARADVVGICPYETVADSAL